MTLTAAAGRSSFDMAASCRRPATRDEEDEEEEEEEIVKVEGLGVRGASSGVRVVAPTSTTLFIAAAATCS